jgi:hypothetical protein
MEENETNNNGRTIGGIVFVGCMFLGGGIGMLCDKVAVGGAIGMGVGFIAMGVIMAYFGKK